MKNKIEILKGFLLGIIATVCMLYIIGDIEIETNFDFSKKSDQIDEHSSN